MPEQAGCPPSGVRGRVLAAGGALGAALVLGLGVPAGSLAAAAEPGTTAPSAPAATTSPSVTPTTRCQITDPRIPELSGLVVVDGGRMLAMNDGGEQVAVYVLDGACTVLDVRTEPLDPYDPEDLAVGPDGTIWLADTGDNNAVRSTVALIALRPDATTALYRLTYPDGPHDAEALLLAPDGTPYLVTKEILGSSGVYRPVGALAEGAPGPMQRVGTVNVTLTGTPGGPVGRAGQLLITGGAVSRDGARLALRTYTDAYVWPLSGSDVPGALAAAPIRVALPESPQGESISFDAGNRQLVVGSEGLPSVISVVTIPASRAPAPAAAGTPAVSLTDFTGSGLSPLTNAAIAAVAATVVVWLGSRWRRRP